MQIELTIELIATLFGITIPIIGGWVAIKKENQAQSVQIKHLQETLDKHDSQMDNLIEVVQNVRSSEEALQSRLSHFEEHNKRLENNQDIMFKKISDITSTMSAIKEALSFIKEKVK